MPKTLGLKACVRQPNYSGIKQHKKMNFNPSQVFSAIVATISLFLSVPIDGWGDSGSHMLDYAREYTQQILLTREPIHAQKDHSKYIPPTMVILKQNRSTIILDQYTLEQRLGSIEKKIDDQVDIERYINEQKLNFSNMVNNHVTLFTLAFTVFTALTAVIGIFMPIVMYIKHKNYKNELLEIKKDYIERLDEIVKDAENRKSELQKIFDSLPIPLDGLHTSSDNGEPFVSVTYPPELISLAQKEAKDEHDVDALLAKAILAQNNREWQKALSYWDDVLKIIPDNINALFNISVALLYSVMQMAGEEQQYYFHRGDHYFRELSYRQPTYAVWNNWGTLCAERGHISNISESKEYWYKQAANKYEEAIKIDPYAASAWNNWGCLCMYESDTDQNIEVKQYWYAKAEDKFKKAIKFNSKDALAWRNLGVINKHRGKAASEPVDKKYYYEIAISSYKESIKIDPQSAIQWYGLGTVYLDMIAELPDAVERDSWFSDAAHALTTATHIDVKYINAWFNLACLDGLQANSAGCVSYLERWYALKPDTPLIKLNDSDFDSVRDSHEFQTFLEKVQQGANNARQ